jgi:crotonobetainyl-CoA:carnitine CoA-transferase CaiB-like acyl-CoA transferase
MVEDEPFATNRDRVAHRDELERMLEARLTARPASEWVRALNEAGVAAAVINSVGDMLSDPDTVAGLVAELPDGTRQLRTPVRLDGQPLALSSAPPRLGEHDDDIRAAMLVGGRQNGSAT